MRTRTTLLLLLVALAGPGLPHPRHARAGAFTFASESSPELITHPTGYGGSGGALSVSVCIDPASQFAAEMAAAVQNVVATFNAGEPTLGNIALGGANDIPANFVDFESVALHEVGHCLGLAHPNLATESGLASDLRDYTKSGDGPNNSYNLDDGADNIIGSADDVRGDDVNLHWFHRATNNPFTIDAVVDTSTYSRNLADLPPGHGFAANGGRDVASGLGLPPTEAVMQQLTFVDEAQRSLGHDDVATLRLAMAGLDRTQGTGDDYTLALSYAGLTTACDVVIRFSTSTALAQCGVTASFLNGNHLRITSASVLFNPNFNWYFNPVTGPSPTPTQTPTRTTTRTFTPTATPTPTRTPTVTRTATPSRTPTRTPTATRTATPTRTDTPTRTATALPSATPTATASPTLSATNTPVATATPTVSATPSPTPSATPSPSASPSPTDTATPTASATVTATPTTTASPTPGILSGTVLHFGSAVPAAAVLVAANGTSAVTDSAGTYALPATAPLPLLVVPGKSGGADGAIDAFDAVRALQIAAGILPPAGIAQALACDASGNGTVSAHDAALLLRKVVRLLPLLPVGAACEADWLFVPVPDEAAPGEAVLPDTTAPCIPGAIRHVTLPGSSAGQDFLAVPLGDCAGDWESASSLADELGEAPGGGVAAGVSGGPLHGRARSLRFPVAVAAGTLLSSFEATIAYDAGALAVEEVRRVGAARNALFVANDDGAGRLRLALASAQPLTAGDGPLLVVHFAPQRRSAARASVNLVDAAIDGSRGPAQAIQ